MKNIFTLCYVLAMALPVVVFTAQNVYAQSNSQGEYVETKKWFLTDADRIPSHLKNHAFKPEIEPQFRPVDYKALTPPKTLRERIERLVFGVQTDVPPVFDIYGYEIRRFMAHVSGPLVLNAPQNLEGQLQNIQTAKKILRAWQDHLNTEISEIRATMDEVGAPSSERSLFKYNAGIVYAFLVDMNNWLNANQRVLEYLNNLGPENYSFQDPIFSFKDTKHMKNFREIYYARTEALGAVIDKYPPFRMMIY